MNNIPKKLREEIAEDPFMKACVRRFDGGCHGRITWEHALYYAGSQIQETFAIIPLCEYHHLGIGLNKEKNQTVALARATEKQLSKYPKSDWKQRSKYLKEKYHQFLRQLSLTKPLRHKVADINHRVW